MALKSGGFGDGEKVPLLLFRGHYLAKELPGWLDCESLTNQRPQVQGGKRCMCRTKGDLRRRMKWNAGLTVRWKTGGWNGFTRYLGGGWICLNHKNWIVHGGQTIITVILCLIVYLGENQHGRRNIKPAKIGRGHWRIIGLLMNQKHWKMLWIPRMPVNYFFLAFCYWSTGRILQTIDEKWCAW